MPLDKLPISNLPLDTFVELGFYLSLAAYIIFTLILYYHWKEYAPDPKVEKITYIIYFATTVPLLFVLGILTLLIS